MFHFIFDPYTMGAMVLAMVITLVAIPPIVRTAKANGLVAKMNGRTSHNGDVPLLGGAAILLATLTATSFITPVFEFHFLKIFLPVMIFLFMMGVKDDLIDMPMRTKLIYELACAIIISAFGFRIVSFYGILGIYTLPTWFSYFFTVFVIIGITNAFNLLDGIDGLASGIGITSAAVLGTWLFATNQGFYSVLAFSLVGSLSAYFYFNVWGKKYKIFMGDAGSLLIGFIISILAIKILEIGSFPNDFTNWEGFPIIVMSTVIIPIVDTLRVSFTRIIKGQSPFYPDKIHLHHYMLKLGFSHLAATVIIVTVNLAFTVLAFALGDMQPFALAMIILFGALAVTLIPIFIVKNRQKSQVGAGEPLQSAKKSAIQSESVKI